MSKSATSDLIWWKTNIPSSYRFFKTKEFYKTIYTDASDLGWGATDGVRKVFGFWSKDLINDHINYKELLTVKLALTSLADSLKDCHILLRIDNTTAIAYINKMGGISFKRFSRLTRSIWKWAEARNIFLTASYIPSKENVEADILSRLVNPDAEWELSQEVFYKMVEFFGFPEIDLFASALNKKCTNYCSWLPDKFAFTIDSFTINWKDLNFYAFPPFILIPKVLGKIKNDKAKDILVVPYWPNQPWYPVFNSLVINNPLFFGPHPDLLLSVNRRCKFLGAEHLIMIVAYVSGIPF